jgi:hypothetical protein
MEAAMKINTRLLFFRLTAATIVAATGVVFGIVTADGRGVADYGQKIGGESIVSCGDAVEIPEAATRPRMRFVSFYSVETALHSDVAYGARLAAGEARIICLSRNLI